MHNLVLLIEHYGLIVVFLNVLLSQAGLPLPVYPVLVTATALAAGAGADDMTAVPAILAAGVAAAFIADLTWFSAGRAFGKGVLSTLCRISLAPDSCVRQTEATFVRFGPASLSFAKFVPGLTNIAVALAGTARTSWAAFLFFDLIGATLFIGAAVALGVIFRDAIGDVLLVLDAFGRFGLVLIAAALALFLVGKWWQRQRFIRQLRMDRISVEELRELIADGASPIILDVRSDALRDRDGFIPGSVRARMSELEDLKREYARETEVVVYCSCPNEASAAMAARHLKRAGFRRIRPLQGGLEAWALAGHPVSRNAEATEDSVPLVAA
ncbi:MAG TPA: rhodanese-like domain-containing protein [Micropepsaceae bacterium]|nr:rhodanese-like domain-containing protein [Micropepsaceae bacterium]